MLTVLGIIFIAVIAFVALGLLGWLGQAIAWIAEFLGGAWAAASEPSCTSSL